MSIQRSCTSSPPRWKYDVFLSFRGDDTRKIFTDHLYTTLEHQGIITFRDEPQLQKGKAISPELFFAIEESRFALIVLSQDYASSTWCLDELVTILECMNATETVLPIFYNVDPSDVRKQTGSFREAFTKYEERFGDDKEKLQRWRSALTQVASFSGWNSKEWYESKLIEDIVEVIWKRLQPTLFSSVENLVGIDTILQPINLLLGTGVEDVRFIGIWGMGGIGKTTMVRVVYERISGEFELSFLLTNVRNSVEKSGLLNLQKQLLSGIWTKKGDISDLHEGTAIIRRLLGHKKVLLILDDVNHSSHLKYLAGNQEWFGSGSRVLITTKNEHLLIEHGVERRLKAEELNYDDSLQLFSQKAFKRDYPEQDFLDLSKSAMKYAKDYEEKKIFLDIACFFNGEDKDRLTEVLTSSDVSTIIGIQVLKERSLLTLSNGRLWMHDLLREMGCEIVRRESLDEPGKRSRLWLPEDINHVLRKNTGTEAIEGISMNSTDESRVEVDVNAKSFSMMSKLRYLKINYGNLPNGIECLPNSLRILKWTGYPSKSLPQYFNPEKLLELSLCHSCIKHFHLGMKPLYNLKTVDLSHSVNLLSTPDFRIMLYLELLILEGCTRLYKVDPSIEELSRLTVLNLKGCKNLVHFAGSLRGLKSLKVLNLSGCSKVNKLPNDMGHLESLQELYVNGTGIRELPSSIGMLERLTLLNSKDCKNLVHFVGSLRGLKSLKVLNLSDCSKLNKLPNDIGHLESLQELYVNGTGLRELPSSIGMVERLTLLNLKDCKHLVSLPSSLGGFKSLKALDLSGCSKLDKLPDELSHVDCLETLDVSGTGIRELPSLKNLKELSCRGCKGQSPKSWSMNFNPFQLLLKRSYVPGGLSLSCLAGIHSLTKLDLSDCNLFEVAIPSDVGCLSSLRELDLSRNQFVGLPGSICQLSKLTCLYLEGCRKLQTLPELPSLEWLDIDNCISLDALSNPIEQCNSVLSTRCFNCFKLVENEEFKSIALLLLTRYFQVQGFKHPYRFNFVGPGNEIPKWFNHQSEGCSIIVEVHPGWFSNKWMGFALCAVFRLLKPLPTPSFNNIHCLMRANGIELYFPHPILPLGEVRAQPVLDHDHIWLFYLNRDIYFHNKWQDIYYQFEFSFALNYWQENDAEVVEVKKCGVRMIYEEDAEEVWQTVWKHSNVGINTKRGLQHVDDDTASVVQEGEEEPHPKIFKQLDLDLNGAGPSGSACIDDQEHDG
ncbi:hypothetical protein M0R45_015231 [Rubus argutus]|uniref:ADP-ribosyl cyclase/cyclic ADP-ribose hydrolase n=1 Tax=Rubus argutus TaxID=59490 RepID=A0AAW1XP22_RUBAR